MPTSEPARPRRGVVDDLAPLLPLRRGDPRKGQSLRLNAQEAEDLVEDGEAASRVVIPGSVVAVGGVATGDDHAVRAALERLDDEEGVDPAGAGEADDPHVWVHLQPARAREVGTGVRAPVAHERRDPRFESLDLLSG
jgi:hypothetical protein